LANAERIQQRHVVIVGSSGLAACMYERGTTAHYMLNIPINNPLDFDIMRYNAFRDLDFWQNLSLIIWDELPMVNKETIEYVNNLLKHTKI